mmetsp:Transcript_61037/g.176776  ORF Transcript_61037/g.176776 Transcript_61037/m.176776 type:complete len:371 (+) Transcript_61037:483-1595(+)
MSFVTKLNVLHVFPAGRVLDLRDVLPQTQLHTACTGLDAGAQVLDVLLAIFLGARLGAEIAALPQLRGADRHLAFFVLDGRHVRGVRQALQLPIPLVSVACAQLDQIRQVLAAICLHPGVEVEAARALPLLHQQVLAALVVHGGLMHAVEQAPYNLPGLHVLAQLVDDVAASLFQLGVHADVGRSGDHVQLLQGLARRRQLLQILMQALLHPAVHALLAGAQPCDIAGAGLFGFRVQVVVLHTLADLAPKVVPADCAVHLHDFLGQASDHLSFSAEVLEIRLVEFLGTDFPGIVGTTVGQPQVQVELAVLEGHLLLHHEPALAVHLPPVQVVLQASPRVAAALAGILAQRLHRAAAGLHDDGAEAHVAGL